MRGNGWKHRKERRFPKLGIEGKAVRQNILREKKESDVRIYAADSDVATWKKSGEVCGEMEHVRMMENEEEIRVHEEEWPGEKIRAEEEGLELRKREGAQERPKKKIKREAKRGTG